jgi:hypothetical protein
VGRRHAAHHENSGQSRRSRLRVRRLLAAVLHRAASYLLDFVRRPSEDGEYETKWFRAMTDHLIFLDDESELGTAIDIVVSLIRARMPNIVDQIDLVNIAESETSKFLLRVGPPWTVHDKQGAERGLAVRFEENSRAEFHEVEAMEITGEAVIEVVELSLTHRRLGDVAYAFGEGVIADKPALVLITEDKDASKITLRFRET